MAEKKIKRQPGRPRNVPSDDTVVDEKEVKQLDMSKAAPVTLEDVGKKWYSTYFDLNQIRTAYSQGRGDSGTGSFLSVSNDRWNELNPFLQSQRLKMLNQLPSSYSKDGLVDMLKAPQDHESQLQSAGWYLSSSQQIYLNILNRSRDIPLYKWYVTPDYQDKDEIYKKDDFVKEYRLATKWLQTFNVPVSLKTDALDVKRNGKVSYLLRSKFTDDHKDVAFAALEKMPANWIKITGIGQLGYTVSFNMMYFMNIANSPRFFGDYIEKAWAELNDKGIVTTEPVVAGSSQMKYSFHPDKAFGFVFKYDGENYSSMLESNIKDNTFMFWLKMPYDLCFTVGSDLSHSWVTPDTVGMFLGLQELSDYAKLAGLIQSTPLTAILTGEAEFVTDAQAGNNMTKLSAEALSGLQTIFNTMTSTNVEAFFAPLKDIKLQQLNADVNSSTITSDATQNFITQAGEGGLEVTDSKPNVSQVHGVQYLAQEKEHYVTLQFERVLNFILQHKLGFKYRWTIHLWGSVYTYNDELKYLKEEWAAGAKFVLPKLLSSDDINILDARATISFIDSLNLYKDFETPTMEKQAELNLKAQANNAAASSGDGSKPGAGRPAKPADQIDNESTAASRDAGTNTADNRD
jgi:hypothetical protein